MQKKAHKEKQRQGSRREKGRAIIDKKLGKYEPYRKFKEDYGYRTIVLSIGDAVGNVVFACFNGVTAIVYGSLWYGALAGYYIILSFQRILVLMAHIYITKKCGKSQEKAERAKLKVYLANGAIFVPMDIALATVAGLMVLHGKPTETGQIMAIATAAYAFCKIITAIVHSVKTVKKVKDPLVRSIRNIGLADALVSMLVLETTLIGTFGGMDDTMRKVIFVSCIAVCAFILGLGSYMIIKASKKLGIVSEEKHG